MMDLSEIMLNSMANVGVKQAYVQGFDCGFIILKSL